jgi:hypothetical protein
MNNHHTGNSQAVVVHEPNMCAVKSFNSTNEMMQHYMYSVSPDQLLAHLANYAMYIAENDFARGMLEGLYEKVRVRAVAIRLDKAAEKKS